MSNALLKEIIDGVVRAAVESTSEEYDYLPNTPEEVQAFVPHQWVKDAILVAYMIGANHGAETPQSAPDNDEVDGAIIAMSKGHSPYNVLFKA